MELQTRRLHVQNDDDPLLAVLLDLVSSGVVDASSIAALVLLLFLRLLFFLLGDFGGCSVKSESELSSSSVSNRRERLGDGVAGMV